GPTTSASVRPVSVPAAAGAAATTTAAATAATLGAGTRLAHVDGAAADVFAVQRVDCGVGLARRRHLDEPEPTRPTAVAVRHDRNRLAVPELAKQRFQLTTRCVEGQVADEDALAHSADPSLTFSRRRSSCTDIARAVVGSGGRARAGQ